MFLERRLRFQRAHCSPSPTCPAERAPTASVTEGGTLWDSGKAGFELNGHTSDALAYHNLAGGPEPAATDEKSKKLVGLSGWKP
jgi:hypothetical protein